MRLSAFRSVALAALLGAFLVGGCASTGTGKGGATQDRTFTVLSINDVYRIEGVDDGAEGGLARVRSLRTELEGSAPDLLVLHAGDFLYPSLLSRTFDGQQMVDVMNLLDGNAGDDGESTGSSGFDPRLIVTFGNHEFDKARLKHAANLDRRLAESQFRWLDTNLDWATGDDGTPLVEDSNLVDSILIEAGGVQVGLFSLTTDIKDPQYVAEIRDPVEVARASTKDLRARGAEVVIGLTHLPADEDAALLAELGDEGPDVVFGGHDHTALSRWVWYRGRQGRWVLKADAEARTSVVAHITLAAGGDVRVHHERRSLIGQSPPPDPLIAQRVEGWIDRFDTTFCAGLELETGCLEEVVGHTQVKLIAEELAIRRFETNLGNWAADRLRESFADQGAQIAFVNSGTLRLNQDLPPGELTRRHVEELFAFPAGARLVQIDGTTLQQIADRTVEDWNGSGHWLQISGFAFRHDPVAGTATDLTLLTPEGPRPVDPEEPLLAVTVDYLVNPEIGDQDGYQMLRPESVIAEGDDLKALVQAGLGAAEAKGIAPEVEGRICNPQQPGPCLAGAP